MVCDVCVVCVKCEVWGGVRKYHFMGTATSSLSRESDLPRLYVDACDFLPSRQSTHTHKHNTHALTHALIHIYMHTHTAKIQ